MVTSNTPVEGLDFKAAAPGRELRLVGEAKEILFIDDIKEGVNGVFASERARDREGVFGWLCIVILSVGSQNKSREQKEQTMDNNAFPT